MELIIFDCIFIGLDVATSKVLSEIFGAGLSGAQGAVEDRFLGPCALHDSCRSTDFFLFLLLYFLFYAAPMTSSVRFFLLSCIIDRFL